MGTYLSVCAHVCMYFYLCLWVHLFVCKYVCLCISKFICAWNYMRPIKNIPSDCMFFQSKTVYSARIFVYLSVPTYLPTYIGTHLSLSKAWSDEDFLSLLVIRWGIPAYTWYRWSFFFSDHDWPNHYPLLLSQSVHLTHLV